MIDRDSPDGKGIEELFRDIVAVVGILDRRKDSGPAGECRKLVEMPVGQALSQRLIAPAAATRRVPRRRRGPQGCENSHRPRCGAREETPGTRHPPGIRKEGLSNGALRQPSRISAADRAACACRRGIDGRKIVFGQGEIGQIGRRQRCLWSRD